MLLWWHAQVSATPLLSPGGTSGKIAEMITKENKAKVIATTQRHKTDVGSPEAQAAILTERIKEITAHLQNNKHDNLARRGLLQLVGQRKRLLKHLQEKNYEAYQAVVAQLGLRK